MGLFTYTLAGGVFILIGAWEFLLSSSQTLRTPQPSPSQSPPLTPPPSKQPKTTPSPPSHSTITFIAISLLSFFFILNSLISLTSAVSSKDQSGVVLQLQVIAIAALFFAYSLLGLLTRLNISSIHLPSSILNIFCLFAFIEEFMLFYIQKKDTIGIENHYFDLMLVPITVCVVSTVLELKTLRSEYARLGRGVGLILQGMWLIQMGFSFYSDLIVHGCYLSEKSRGNFTVKCKGHPEYHRGRAIATLQFNCHLALLVALLAGVYSIVCKKHGVSRGELTRYRPIGAEMQQLDGQAQFTLDSDDDDESGIVEEKNVVRQKALPVVPELGVNGFGSHH
ncbi:hypothetical protein RJ640_029886 [Escallonia rubra]|uniref:Uncharacterized protein n=1 Tax=Escallonia rubra TaxID=112253 RepID=A0AA88QJU2_9ASTE|nr:hypothetical protein RJ640_029886 [Escallonia rubra]